MHGFWFAAMICVLMAAGVIAQLGWQLPEKAQVKRAFRRERARSAEPPTHLPTSVPAAGPR